MTIPFVLFKMQPTLNISSTPIIIFGNDKNTCLLDGIILTNTTNNVIIVSLSLAREIETGTETYFTLADKISLQPKEFIDVLHNKALTLESGDLLYASSDYSSNIFNTFVSYRPLTEL